MFNSMGAMGEYNDLFDKYPALLGGAIWEWEDQGFWNRRDPKRPFIAYGGGFGDFPNDHYFIHKGVIFSDRSPKPHYPELKRVYQWISFDPENLAAGKIGVRNRYAFTNLNKFTGTWKVTEDGKVIDRGAFSALDLAPGASGSISATFRKITPKPGAEYFLEIAFALAKDAVWAKAGYEVANAQFKLQVEAPPTSANTSQMKPVKLSEDARSFTVTGDGFSVVFDKAEGGIAQLVRDGVSLLAAGGGPKMNFYRAPHRNDDNWAERQWNQVGLNALKFRAVSIAATQLDAASVRVNAVVMGEGTGDWSVRHTAVYTVYGDGSIVADNSIDPKGQRIPLARVAVRLLVDKRLDRFTYLGRGPMENYADRKRGFDVGLYSSTVKEQLTPYAKPMEAGNHEDVRWAQLSAPGMPGLLAQLQGTMQVSALPYTDEQMVKPEYAVDLPESNLTALILAAKTLGVGSASCGPRPLEQYVVWSDPATFRYSLRLVSKGAKDIAVQSRLAPPTAGGKDSAQ